MYLGAGRYRKHFVQSRECNDMWAINVHASSIKVQDCVKHITRRVSMLQHSKNSAIFNLCQDIASSSTPPTRVRDGVSACYITGMKTDDCVIISRVKNQSMQRTPKKNPSDTSTQDMGSSVDNVRFMQNLNQTTTKADKVSQNSHDCKRDLLNVRFDFFLSSVIVWFDCVFFSILTGTRILHSSEIFTFLYYVLVRC